MKVFKTRAGIVYEESDREIIKEKTTNFLNTWSGSTYFSDESCGLIKLDYLTENLECQRVPIVPPPAARSCTNRNFGFLKMNNQHTCYRPKYPYEVECEYIDPLNTRGRRMDMSIFECLVGNSGSESNTRNIPGDNDTALFEDDLYEEMYPSEEAPFHNTSSLFAADFTTERSTSLLEEHYDEIYYTYNYSSTLLEEDSSDGISPALALDRHALRNKPSMLVEDDFNNELLYYSEEMPEGSFQESLPTALTESIAIESEYVDITWNCSSTKHPSSNTTAADKVYRYAFRQDGGVPRARNSRHNNFLLSERVPLEILTNRASDTRCEVTVTKPRLPEYIQECKEVFSHIGWCTDQVPHRPHKNNHIRIRIPIYKTVCERVESARSKRLPPLEVVVKKEFDFKPTYSNGVTAILSSFTTSSIEKKYRHLRVSGACSTAELNLSKNSVEEFLNGFTLGLANILKIPTQKAQCILVNKNGFGTPDYIWSDVIYTKIN